MVTSFRLSKAIRIQITINKFQNIHKSRLSDFINLKYIYPKQSSQKFLA